MMPSRATLLQHFAADLASVRPMSAGKIVCPLCLREYDLQAENDSLTVEHIIPSAVGGNATTIACRTCNNGDGHTLDAHFVRMLRAQEWSNGDGSLLRGTVRLADTTLPMNLSWGDPRIIRIIGEKPATLAAFKLHAHALRSGDQLHLTISFNYKVDRARRALVRMGYLALFDHLGYEYVYSGAGQWARSMITGSAPQDLWRCTPQMAHIAETSKMPPITVSPVARNQEIIAYFILLRIDDKRTSHHAVILPATAIPAAGANSVLDDVANGLKGNRQTIQVVA